MPSPSLTAADRLLSFYKDSELLARSGTLASVKSFGSQAGLAPSLAAGGAADGRSGSKGGRPDANDVVIDPYDLNSSDLESSTDSGFDSNVEHQIFSEAADDADWTASGYGDSDGYDRDPASGGGLDSPAATPSRQGPSGGIGGGSRAVSARSRFAGSVAGGAAASTGDLRTMRTRASFTVNSFRSRSGRLPSSGGGGSVRRVGVGLSNLAPSLKASRGRGADGGSPALLSFKKSAGAIAAAAGSFKSRASVSTHRSGGGLGVSASAPAAGGVTATSFKSYVTNGHGDAQRGSFWTRALKPPGGAATVAASAAAVRSGGGGGGRTLPIPSVVGSVIGRVAIEQGSGPPAAAAAVKNRISGKHVWRRLRRRRGWDFDVVPAEIDFQLGRPLPHVLTRPQPTVNSEDEEAEAKSSSSDDDGGGSLSGGGNEPPPGPALEAIKSYARERAPDVLWSERLLSAKLMARSTGQAVTVKGRMDRRRRRDLARKIQKWDNREWFANRKRTPPAPPLHPAVARVIEQWFSLVDDDGSGTLDHRELLAALRASKVPVSPDNINEMISLMDMDGDGVINWKEFETFFMYEFAAGKNLLSGEYVLPSGVALPFGAMIAKLKRAKLLSDLTQGGAARAKWMQVADNPVEMEDELGMMAAVEMAMEEIHNPALAQRRLRAAKALNRLPPHLRTKSLGRHLERHPEIAEKVLRAGSIAPFLISFASMKRSGSTTSQVMARLASSNSQGSMGSSAAPSGNSTSANSSGGAGNGQKGGRGRNVDLNVAAALAAGLEWPVSGANFYNRRARTILRAVCHRPVEGLLKNRTVPAATKRASVFAPSSPPRAAADGGGAATTGGDGGGDGPAPTGTSAGPQEGPAAAGPEADAGSPVGRRTTLGKGGALDARAAFAMRAGSHRMGLRNSTMLAHGRSRRKDSDNDADDADDEEGSDGGRRRRRSTSSEEVLPWFVNAKRREEEERQQLRAQLRGRGGGTGSSSNSDGDGDGRSSGLGIGGEGDGDKDSDVWISPMLRAWLRQEHELHRTRRMGMLGTEGAGEKTAVAPHTASVAPSDGGNGVYASEGGATGEPQQPVTTARPQSDSRGGSGLVRLLLERSVNMPPELETIHAAAAAAAAATNTGTTADADAAPGAAIDAGTDAGAGESPLPLPLENPPRSAKGPGSVFAAAAGEVPAAAAAASAAPPTPTRLIPPPVLVTQGSWGPSVDTPSRGGGVDGGRQSSLGTPLGDGPWSSGTPRTGTVPVEGGRPRKPRRRMRFEDEQDVTDTVEASFDADKSPAAPEAAAVVVASRLGGLVREASNRSLASAFSLVSGSGGARGASPEDGGGPGGGGGDRGSPGAAAAGRAFLLRSHVMAAELSGSDSPRASEVSEPVPPAAGSGGSCLGPMRSQYGVRVKELPAAAAAADSVRQWSAAATSATAPPLLRSAVAGGSNDDMTRVSQWQPGGSGGGDATYCESDEEVLEADEARELMAALTLDVRKDEKLYDIHNGYLSERPTTGHFRAALSKIRTEASALLQSHSLPSHPDYSGAASSAAAAAAAAAPAPAPSAHQRPRSPPTGSSLTARSHVPAAAALPPGPMARVHASTSSGGCGSGVSVSIIETVSSPRIRGANTRGPGGRCVKQLANRHRSLLVNGVHMRSLAPSMGGGPSPAAVSDSGAAAAATDSGRRRPTSPASRMPVTQPVSSRGLSYTSIGFSHVPGLSGGGGPEDGGGGGGGGGFLPSAAQSSGVESYFAAAAAVAAEAAEGLQGAPMVAVTCMPDAGVPSAAIDTTRSASASRSRSRSPSQCRSPASRSPIALPPLSLAGYEVVQPNSGGAGPPSVASTCPTAAPPLQPQLSASANPPGALLAADVSYGSGNGSGGTPAAAALTRAVRPGHISPMASLSSPPPQPPEGWDAHVAAMLQRRTEAELAAVQRSYRSGHTPRDGATTLSTRAVSPEVLGHRSTGGGSTQHGSYIGISDGMPPGAAAGATAVVTAAGTAALADVLLGPAGTTLPDFVPVPGVSPPLQSRYAPKPLEEADKPPAPLLPPDELALSSGIIGLGSVDAHAGMGAEDAGASDEVMEAEAEAEGGVVACGRGPSPEPLAARDMEVAANWALAAVAADSCSEDFGADHRPASEAEAGPGPEAGAGVRVSFPDGEGQLGLGLSNSILLASKPPSAALPSGAAGEDAKPATGNAGCVSPRGAAEAEPRVKPRSTSDPGPATESKAADALGMTAATGCLLSAVVTAAAPTALLNNNAELGSRSAAAVAAMATAAGEPSEDCVPAASTSTSSSAATATTAVAAAGVARVPRFMRRFTLSTEGSESPSQATITTAATCDGFDDMGGGVSPRGRDHSAPLRAAQGKAQAAEAAAEAEASPPLLTEPDPIQRGDEADAVAGDVNDASEAMVAAMMAAESRTASGQWPPQPLQPRPQLASLPPLSMDEALLMSGFGKPQTPTLARIERGTTRMALGGTTSRHNVGFSEISIDMLPQPQPPSAAAAAPSSSALCPPGPHGGGGVSVSVSGTHPSGFTLPAPSRLKLSVPHLQLHSHQYHNTSPPAPGSPRSLAPTTARVVSASGSSQASDVGGHGRGVVAGCTGTAASAGLALSGRSRTALHALAVTPQPAAAATTVASAGEQLDGGGGGGGSGAPIGVLVAAPLPPLQGTRSQNHLPNLHLVHTFPSYHSLPSNPNQVHQHQQLQWQGSVCGGEGSHGGSNVSGGSISGNPSACGPSPPAVTAVAAAQQLQLPPLREPGSPRRGDLPWLVAQPPLPGRKHGEHLGDGSATGGAAAAGRDKQAGSKSARGRSTMTESLPALPMRVHSQGNLALQHPSAKGGGGEGGPWPRGAPFRAISINSSTAASGSGDRDQVPSSLPPQPTPPPEYSSQSASVVHRRAAWVTEPSAVPAASPLSPMFLAAVASASPAAAAAAAVFAPAPPTAPLVSPVTLLTDLPDIVTLLSNESRPPVRIGPTRVRKMDY